MFHNVPCELMWFYIRIIREWERQVHFKLLYCWGKKIDPIWYFCMLDQ